MQIKKYKKISTNKYRLYLENGNNIDLYDDIIIKYNLLIKKDINEEQLNEIEKDNNNYSSYYIALKYISVKIRCEKEIRKYLSGKNIDNNFIEFTIKKLKDEGYIDNKKYINSYIYDKLNISKYGPNKIRDELIKLGFTTCEIDEGFSKIDNSDVINILNSLIDKKIKQSKGYSGSVLKSKILIYFTQRGFERRDILSILDNKSLNDQNQFKKEYDKLYKKYSKKYSGYELDNIIKQKLYQKGFNYN